MPAQKRIRMIVHTDCKNEVNDQFMLAHHVMTPRFDVKGVVAGHFDVRQNRYLSGKTAKASHEEAVKVLELMHVKKGYPVYLGAGTRLSNEHTPIDS